MITLLGAEIKFDTLADIVMALITAASVIVAAHFARKTRAEGILAINQAVREQAESDSIYQQVAGRTAEMNAKLIEANSVLLEKANQDHLRIAELEAKIISHDEKITRLFSALSDKDAEISRLKNENVSLRESHDLLQRRVNELEGELSRYVKRHGKLTD